MLFRLLGKSLSPLQLLGAMLGTVIGMLLLLCTNQLYQDVQAVLDDQQQLLEPEYLVVSKQISIFRTLKLASTGFSEAEIEGFRNEAFLEDLAPFTAARFKVSAFTDGSDDLPPFYSELFFEAVPDAYLDRDELDWQWHSRKKLVPIVIPKDYLRLYNFGFAQSQGLPQLTPGLIGMINFSLRLEGNGKEEVLQGHIAGFSDRLNTILVPQDFMNWANKEFGEGPARDPARLILVTRDPADPALATFLEKNGLDAAEDKLKSGRINALLTKVLSITGALGSVIILLAFLVFFLSFQLIVHRSARDLTILIRLGYAYQKLAWGYIGVFVVVIGAVLLGTLFALTTLREWASDQFEQAGFEFPEDLHYTTWMLGFCTAFLLVTVNGTVLYQQLRKLA